MSQQLTEKSDVYSFGVVMLELLTARQPIEKRKYIVREITMALDRSEAENYGLKQLMDPSLKTLTNLAGFERYLDLALQCVKESAADRPTMNEVVKTLETILMEDGLNTNSTTSANSSATDFGYTNGAPPTHPYDANAFSKKDGNDSDAFQYSGGFNISAKVEPK